MPDTTVAQPEVAPTETAPAETAPASTETDPFAVDESQFVSLTPEQRAALDPVLSKWKENAKSYAQKEREAEGKKYTDHVKRSAALENLVKDPQFVEWYNKRMNPQSSTTTPSYRNSGRFIRTQKTWIRLVVKKNRMRRACCSYRRTRPRIVGRA